MPLPLIPVAIALMAGSAFAAHKMRKKELKPEHKQIYETAMQTEKNPAKLQALASAFEACGHDAHAEMLIKRAKLRSLPPDIKAARRNIYKQCMNESDPAKVEKMAAVFNSEGATDAAKSLYKHAEALRAA